MKIFLDTADLDEIENAISLGIIDGVTTNPCLIAKHKKDLFEHLKRICNVVDGPVFAQVTKDLKDEIVEQAIKLSKISDRLVVKIPSTLEGIKALTALKQHNFPKAVTLVFSTSQALIAAKHGATYVSPFVGRICDSGADGIKILQDIAFLFEKHSLKTEIVAASLRSPLMVEKALTSGAHCATMTETVLRQMIVDQRTEDGVRQFLQEFHRNG